MNTKQLRQKILDLAIKGKLVPQDPNDEPACKLLERIREEKEQLIKDGKLKRDKNESYIFVGDDKLHYEKFADGSVVCIEDEIPFEIPETWAWCKMQNCIDVRDGTHDSPKYVEYGIPLITSKNISSGYLDFSNIQYISKDDHLSISMRSKVDKGDILFAMIGSIGNPVIVDTDKEFSIKNVALFKNFEQQQMCMQYLYFYLFFIQKQLQTNAKGGNQPFVPLAQLRTMIIPIPPISEQQRISETVETLLQLVETIDSDKINLSDLIKQTKSKVLDLAIKGKLVPQDPNDEPADKLLERIREEKEKLIKEGKLKRDKNETYIFKNSDDNSYYEQIDGEAVCIDDDLPFEIPDSWRWCKLKDIGTIVGGGTPKTEVKENWENGDIPWLTPADMRNIKSKYVKGGERNITLQGYNSSSTIMLSPNSIVYSSRAPIGYVAITQNSLCTNQGFKSVDLYYKECSNYTYYLLKALTTDIVNRASGTTFKEISGSEFGQTFVPLPPLNEQIKIGKNIDSIFGYLDDLESIIKGS